MADPVKFEPEPIAEFDIADYGQDTENSNEGTEQSQEVQDQKSDEKVEKVEETPKVDVENKAEEKVNDKPAEKTKLEKLRDDVAKRQSTQNEAQEQDKRRDYSKYTAEDQLWLRGIRNSGYPQAIKRLEHFYEVEKKLAESEKKITELAAQQEQAAKQPSIIDHPEGYKLSEDYAKVDADYRYAKFESDFLEEQLLNVEQGKPFRIIEKYDEKGQPIFSQYYKVTKENQAANRVAIQNSLGKLNLVSNQLEQQLGGFQKTFKASYDRDLGIITKAADETFGAKLPEHLRPAKEDVDKFLSQIPGTFRSHPMTKVTAQLYGLTMKQFHKITEQQTEINRLNGIKKDQQKAGPVTEQKAAQSISKDKKEVDFAELEKEFS